MKNKCSRCGRRIPKGQNICDNCNRTLIDKVKRVGGIVVGVVVIAGGVIYKILRKTRII